MVVTPIYIPPKVYEASFSPHPHQLRPVFQGEESSLAPSFRLTGCQTLRQQLLEGVDGGFPGGAVVKNSPANAGDPGLSPGPGRSHMWWSN